MSWESILKNYGQTKESEAIETVKKLKKVGKEAGWNITFVDLLILGNIMANELEKEKDYDRMDDDYSSELKDIMMKLDKATNDVEDMLIETQKYFEKNEIDGRYWQGKQRDD